LITQPPPLRTGPTARERRRPEQASPYASKPTSDCSATATAHVPPELACRYETICETCSCYAPTNAFRDTLQNQHDDADAHGDPHRQQVYATILSDLDHVAS